MSWRWHRPPPPANIVFTLDELDLRRHFDAVVGAADVARGKPHPDVFLKAAEKLGVRLRTASCSKTRRWAWKRRGAPACARWGSAPPTAPENWRART